VALPTSKTDDAGGKKPRKCEPSSREAAHVGTMIAAPLLRRKSATHIDWNVQGRKVLRKCGSQWRFHAIALLEV
jgi:hypothetical protein